MALLPKITNMMKSYAGEVTAAAGAAAAAAAAAGAQTAPGGGGNPGRGEGNGGRRRPAGSAAAAAAAAAATAARKRGVQASSPPERLPLLATRLARLLVQSGRGVALLVARTPLLESTKG